MPQFYKYKKVTDQYTVYQLQLPEPAEDQPGMIDLGEIDGETYVCVPDWMHPLPAQPKQIALAGVAMDEKMADKLKAASPVLKLAKARMEGKATRVRYSKRDELTLQQMASVLPSAVTLDAKDVTLDEHISNFRKWDKSVAVEPVLELIR